MNYKSISRRDKMVESAEKSLTKYREDYLAEDYLAMGATDILRYAKQGFFCKEDGAELVYNEDKDAYKILRFAKEGKLKVCKQNG